MLEPQRQSEPGMLDLPSFSDDFELTEGLDAEGGVRPWWRRGWIVAVSVVALVAIIAGGTLAFARGRKTPVTYQFATVAQGNLATSISATGPLQGTIYDATFSGSGKLAEIDVAIGQKVKVGDTLAKLDPTSLQDALNQAQVALSSAQTALGNAQTNQGNVQAQTQAQVAAAFDQEQNAINACNNPPKGTTAAPNCLQLAQDQFASAQAQANAQNASAQAQVSSAQAQLSSAQAALQTATHNARNATLTAPHAGTVAVINGVVGGTPGSASGSSSSTGSAGGVFIEIVDLSSVQVLANVNEADIGGVALGNTASFTVSAYPNRQFRAKISAISPLGVTVSNVVTYPITLDVDTTTLGSANLLPGMTANVTIVTQQRTGVTLVPASALTFAVAAASPARYNLIPRAQLTPAITQARQMLRDLRTSTPNIVGDNPQASIVLERAGGQWVVKPVVLGLTDGSNYEVLSGLSTGESIVVGATGLPGASTSTSTSGGLRLPGAGGGGNGGGGTGGGNAGGGTGG